MESRTTLYGPMLAIIALSLVATSGIPIPLESNDGEDVAVTTWPQLLSDRAIAFATAL